MTTSHQSSTHRSCIKHQRDISKWPANFIKAELTAHTQQQLTRPQAKGGLQGHQVAEVVMSMQELTLTRLVGAHHEHPTRGRKAGRLHLPARRGKMQNLNRQTCRRDDVYMEALHRLMEKIWHAPCSNGSCSQDVHWQITSITPGIGMLSGRDHLLSNRYLS